MTFIECAKHVTEAVAFLAIIGLFLIATFLSIFGFPPKWYYKIVTAVLLWLIAVIGLYFAQNLDRWFNADFVYNLTR